jgi:hypothetical protein
LGYAGLLEDTPEIIVPAPRQVRLAGVRSHQSNRLFAHHMTWRDDIRVTTAARTLFDLSSVVGPVLLGKLLNSSMRRHLVTPDDLQRCCDELASRGRRRLTIVRAVLDDRPPGFDPGDSDPETRLVHWLTGAGLPRPVQQHQVVIGRRVFLLDLAYPERKIAIEYDSWEHHGNRIAFHRDSRRRAALDLAGWTYLGVTSAWSRGEFLDAVAVAFDGSLRDECG